MVTCELCVIGVWRVRNLYIGVESDLGWDIYIRIEGGQRCLGRDSA